MSAALSPPRPGVESGGSSRSPSDLADRGPEGLEPGGSPSPGRDHRLRPRHVGLVAAALVVLWVTLVFTRAIGASSAVNERSLQLRAENAQLEQRLAASKRELALLESKPFLLLQARAYGMGPPGERVFALASGAPPPLAIRPLGAEPSAHPPSPLEDWFRLLFGR